MLGDGSSISICDFCEESDQNDNYKIWSKRLISADFVFEGGGMEHKPVSQRSEASAHYITASSHVAHSQDVGHLLQE